MAAYPQPCVVSVSLLAEPEVHTSDVERRLADALDRKDDNAAASLVSLLNERRHDTRAFLHASIPRLVRDQMEATLSLCLWWISESDVLSCFPHTCFSHMCNDPATYCRSAVDVINEVAAHVCGQDSKSASKVNTTSALSAASLPFEPPHVSRTRACETFLRAALIGDCGQTVAFVQTVCPELRDEDLFRLAIHQPALGVACSVARRAAMKTDPRNDLFRAWETDTTAHALVHTMVAPVYIRHVRPQTVRNIAFSHGWRCAMHFVGMCHSKPRDKCGDIGLRVPFELGSLPFV